MKLRNTSRQKKLYDERKLKTLCTQCGLDNDNLPMVRCKLCYQKLKDSRERVKQNGGYK